MSEKKIWGIRPVQFGEYIPLRRTVFKIQDVRYWATKWPMGSGMVSTSRFWAAPVNFPKNKFFNLSTPMRKVYKGEKRKEKKKKIMSF